MKSMPSTFLLKSFCNAPLTPKEKLDSPLAPPKGGQSRELAGEAKTRACSREDESMPLMQMR